MLLASLFFDYVPISPSVYLLQPRSPPLTQYGLHDPPPPALPPPFLSLVPEAELVLNTPRLAVRIRIRGTKCRLLGPDLPELRHLLEAPGMGAGPLIMELERAGICLTPSDEDAGRAAAPSPLAVAAVTASKMRCRHEGGGRDLGEEGQGGERESEEEREIRPGYGIVLKER